MFNKKDKKSVIQQIREDRAAALNDLQKDIDAAGQITDLGDQYQALDVVDEKIKAEAAREGGAIPYINSEGYQSYRITGRLDKTITYTGMKVVKKVFATIGLAFIPIVSVLAMQGPMSLLLYIPFGAMPVVAALAFKQRSKEDAALHKERNDFFKILKQKQDAVKILRNAILGPKLGELTQSSKFESLFNTDQRISQAFLSVAARQALVDWAQRQSNPASTPNPDQPSA